MCIYRAWAINDEPEWSVYEQIYNIIEGGRVWGNESLRGH